jgi:hypothetical protein
MVTCFSVQLRLMLEPSSVQDFSDSSLKPIHFLLVVANFSSVKWCAYEGLTIDLSRSLQLLGRLLGQVRYVVHVPIQM